MPESPVLQHRMILECVAGKDIQKRVTIGVGMTVKVGSVSMLPDLAIDEVTASQGYLLVSLQDQHLVLDAGNCLAPVYINNQQMVTGVLAEHDVLRIGGSSWRARIDNGKSSTDLLKDKFSDLIGLEELKDFKLGDIFSSVFKKHTSQEMEDQLITGTSRHTPALSEIEVGWATPWLFARLLAVSVILAVILYLGFDFFENDNLIPGLIFVGSFAVPISTLIFFLEMNVPRNVSIFTITQLSFVGGIASMIVALIFYSRFDFFTTYLGAPAAGIIEESAKLLIVALLMGKATRYRWSLNGLLFGAAVGTGFGAFESAGFAFREMLKSGVSAGGSSILLRGLDAPFTHIVWTASASAALWLVKGDKPFSWEMLKAPAFLRIFIFVVLLHMIWDTNFQLMPLPLVKDLKFVLLGILGWVICLRLVQAGLQQLNKARQEVVLPVSVVAGSSVVAG